MKYYHEWSDEEDKQPKPDALDKMSDEAQELLGIKYIKFTKERDMKNCEHCGRPLMNEDVCPCPESVIKEDKEEKIKVHRYKLTPAMIGELVVGDEQVADIVGDKLHKEFNELSHGTIKVKQSYWEDGKLVIDFV